MICQTLKPYIEFLFSDYNLYNIRTHASFFPDRQCITLLLQLLTASTVVENCTLYVNLTILYTNFVWWCFSKALNRKCECVYCKSICGVCVCFASLSSTFNMHIPLLSSSSLSPPTFVVEENNLTENRNDKKCYYWLFLIDSIILHMM